MLDDVRMNLDPTMILILNGIIVLNMFAVSLNLRLSDFKAVLLNRKSAAVGLFGQFVFLPFITFLFTLLVPMHTSVALGLIMVSCVPGGNLSNVFSYLSRGNLPLSVALTAIGFPIAMLLTPINFALYSSLHPEISKIASVVSINPVHFALTIAVNLILPLALGCWVGSTFTRFYKAVAPYISTFALLSISTIIVLIFKDNLHIPFEITSQYMGYAIAHHAVVIVSSFLLATALGLSLADKRTVTIEIGIQNAPLGMVLLLTFMPTLGGAATTIAFWGAWQVLATAVLSIYWRRIGPKP